MKGGFHWEFPKTFADPASAMCSPLDTPGTIYLLSELPSSNSASPSQMKSYAEGKYIKSLMACIFIINGLSQCIAEKKLALVSKSLITFYLVKIKYVSFISDLTKGFFNGFSHTTVQDVLKKQLITSWYLGMFS